MAKIKLSKTSKNQILSLAKERNIYLEGNIIKVIDPEGDEEFTEYLNTAAELDKTNRKKRLEVTKQVQLQNKELMASHEENESLMEELKEALEAAENAKNVAQNDLDVLQKKTQFELMSKIVQAAIAVIIGVGVITSLIYVSALLADADTTLIGNAWSNLFGILLTNSFSIIGTIMGVKYSSEKSEE